MLFKENRWITFEIIHLTSWVSGASVWLKLPKKRKQKNLFSKTKRCYIRGIARIVLKLPKFTEQHRGGKLQCTSDQEGKSIRLSVWGIDISQFLRCQLHYINAIHKSHILLDCEGSSTLLHEIFSFLSFLSTVSCHIFRTIRGTRL